MELPVRNLILLNNDKDSDFGSVNKYNDFVKRIPALGKMRNPIYSSQQSSVGDPWHFGADSDPFLLLMDPDLAPDPNPTFFFSDFNDAKKIFFIFSYTGTYPQANYVVLKKFLLKFWVKIYFASIISVRSTPFGEKGRIQIHTFD